MLDYLVKQRARISVGVANTRLRLEYLKPCFGKIILSRGPFLRFGKQNITVRLNGIRLFDWWNCSSRRGSTTDTNSVGYHFYVCVGHPSFDDGEIVSFTVICSNFKNLIAKVGFCTFWSQKNKTLALCVPWIVDYSRYHFYHWLPLSGFSHQLELYYHQICSLKRTFIGNKICDHSDVVGPSPVAGPTTYSFST